MKTLKIRSSLLIIGFIFLLTNCSDDFNATKIPTSEDAQFTFSFDPDNPNKVIFNATTPSDKNWYTHWSFGDNSSAEGYETSKIFLRAGDYDVRFKIFTEGGTAESVQTIVINEDFQGPNVLLNGEFNGTAPWIILPISDGVNVSFDNNDAKWTGGGGGHVGIYQPFQVLANNLYQISMDIKGGPLTDSWFEVYVGMQVPVDGQDYTDGGMRLTLNTWAGCGNTPFDDDFSAISCAGSGSTFEFPTAGTAYIVIRGGGSDFGSNGVTVDNVAIRSLESSVIPSVAGFTFDTSDLTVSFTNTSSNTSSYVWDFGDGVGTSTDENPSYTYSAGGTYNVTLTASNDTESVEITQAVSVIDPSAAPVSGFTFQTNSLTATFTNTSTNATSYSWNFGDGSGTSTDANPSYTFTENGTYSVTLTAINNGLSNEFTANVTVEASLVTNLLTNGSFDDDSSWTFINHYEAANTLGSVTFADGVATFNQTVAGDWKHIGIYTTVVLQPGTYQFDMEMAYNEINDVWGEVYIGSSEPTQNQDYNGDQQVLKAYNAWDCPSIKTYSGLATESGCDPSANPGRFEITTAGTYYLLFRTGGSTFGTSGIEIDNMTLVEAN
uniref:PKD domain-containing protein n=1 Tax=Flavobacterium sp. TaxID=239 RepID=UPI00404A8120